MSIVQRTDKRGGQVYMVPDDELTTGSTLGGPKAMLTEYRVREFNSLLDQWDDREDLMSVSDLSKGMTVEVQRQGFWLFDLQQEV